MTEIPEKIVVLETRKTTSISTSNKRELYDATEYIEKMDLMIAKLRTTKPGELTGKVGKNEILAVRREALQKLVKEGYTANQIADAMKNDVFAILPKTITEILNNKSKKPRAEKLAVVTAQKPKAATSTIMKAQSSISDVGSISITKDSKDL